MPNPFNHQDADGGPAADARLQAQMQADIERRESETDEMLSPGPDHADDIEVDIGAAPSEDDLFDLDEPQDREGKKRNRYREAKEEAEAEREKRLKAEAENAALRAIQSQSAGVTPVPSSDPLQEEIDKTWQERIRLAEQYNQRTQAGQLSDDDDKRMRSEARKLEEKSQQLQYRKLQRDDAMNVDPRQENITMVKMRHPDVAENGQALNWADGEARKRIAKGEQYSMSLVDEIMEEARREFRLGKYRHGVPSDRKTQARYHGAPRGGGSPPSPSDRIPNKVKMTPAMRRMADAAFPGIKDPKKRYQHWAKTAGRSFLEMERSEGR